MKHFISSSLLAALLCSSYWSGGNDAAHFASAEELVEAEQSDAFVANETDVEADSVEADSVEADSVEADSVEADSVEADSVEADSVEADSVEADSVEADSVGTAPVEADSVEADSVEAYSVEAYSVEAAESGEAGQDLNQAEEQIQNLEAPSISAVEPAESVEANAHREQSADGDVTIFSYMRERAKGRINNPKHPLPAFPRPPQQNPASGEPEQKPSMKKNASSKQKLPVRAKAPPPAEKNVADSLMRFLDTALSLGGSDPNKGLQREWVEDIKFLVSNVLMQASCLGDDPDSVGTQLNLAYLADAAHLLGKVKPHTTFLEFFDMPWIQDIINRVGDFSHHLKHLLDQDRYHDAFFHAKGSDVFGLLRLFRVYWDVAPDTLPGAVIRAIKDYDNFLQLISRQKEHKTGIFSEPMDSVSPDDSHPIASAMLLIQKRAEMTNLLSAFETYVLTGFAERLQEMKAAEAEASADFKKKADASFSFSKLLPKVFTVLSEEVEAVEKVKSLMVEVSELCKAFEDQSNIPGVCRSISEVVAAKKDAEDVPRRLQAYWLDAYPIISRVAESFPVEVAPQIDTTLARVPQLFPVFAAAATSTVGALVDGTQTVATTMSSTADEVLNFIQDTTALPLPQLTVPSLN